MNEKDQSMSPWDYISKKDVEKKMWLLVDRMEPWSSPQAADEFIATVRGWATSEGLKAVERLRSRY